MANRKPISTRSRFEVFKRDGFTCQYCGATPPAVVLHVDHITPFSAGGKDTKDNLVTACASCNLGKSNVPLSSTPQSLADKAAEIKEKEAQIRAFRKEIKKQEDRETEDVWTVVHSIYGDSCNSLDRRYITSIRTFLKSLPLHVIVAAGDAAWRISGQSARFKYFCGICWAKIKMGEDNG